MCNAWMDRTIGTDLISEPHLDEPMIKLYENASKAHPKNENLATQWFMSLARTLDFKGQQMVYHAQNCQ